MKYDLGSPVQFFFFFFAAWRSIILGNHPSMVPSLRQHTSCIEMNEKGCIFFFFNKVCLKVCLNMVSLPETHFSVVMLS